MSLNLIVLKVFSSHNPGLRISKSILRKENIVWGRRDGSVVKSTDCSSGGPECNSQQPHGGSQPSVMESDPSGVSEESYSVLYIK